MKNSREIENKYKHTRCTSSPTRCKNFFYFFGFYINIESNNKTKRTKKKKKAEKRK